MLDPSTFRYLKPTDNQLELMDTVRDDFHAFANSLDELLPDGPDKTYVLRHIREAAMWANVAITRYPNGAPRQDDTYGNKDTGC